MEEHDHEYRVGIGEDIHALVEERPLKLGGMEIKYPAGLAGHSDGDVVLHAVIDALLGAACMGDIGTLFPDTDPNYKGIDSKGLLLDVKEKLEYKKWVIVNVDVTIHAERPRLEPYKGQIKRCVSGLLGVDFNAVNIKAKTNEGFDAVGRGEAISSTCIALIKRKYKRTL
ncbi:MAG: 2-C-methyl-D-erythritol 2,4-cyclodiphosphate synthase [Phycisphaerae bacterium]|nr:2-C-methyl-D-erythritol 2,4-cyclodiphosphate synthase [Phycisphaerae bacterium]